MLRDVRLAEPELGGEPAHLPRPVGESVQDLEPPRAGEGLEDLGLEDRDLVHAPSIDRMRICA